MFDRKNGLKDFKGITQAKVIHFYRKPTPFYFNFVMERNIFLRQIYAHMGSDR